MKKAYLHLLCFLTFSIFNYTQALAQCNEWVVTGGTPTATIQHFGSAIDDDGNVLMAAYIDSTHANFNGDAFNSTILLGGDMVILAKVDSNGNNMWTLQLEADAFDILHSLHSDGSNFFLTTSFRGNLLIGNQSLFSSETSILILKLDGMGNLVWLKNYELQTTTLQATTRSWSAGITVDKSGNVFSTGYFTGKLVFGNTNLETNVLAGERQMFTMKLDSMGNELWAIQSISTTNSGFIYNRGWALTTDKNDDVYVGGFYGSTFTIGNVTVQEPDNQLSPYLVKLDGNTGNTIWLQNGVFPVGNAGFSNFYSASVDESNNVIVGGIAERPLTIAGTLVNSSSNQPIIIIKFDSNGNVLFAKAFGSASTQASQWGSNVETDIFNNIYFSGNASGGTTFDNFSINTNVRANFITTMDSLGNVTDLKYIHDANQISFTATYSGVHDNFENIYLSGTYGGTDSLTFNAVNYPSDNSNALGLYLLKACVVKTGFNVSNNKVDIPETFTSTVFPNPNKGGFRVEINSTQSQSVQVSILSELGQLIENQQIELNRGENTVFYDLEKLPSGIYFVHIRANEYSNVQRFIKF